MNCKIPTSALGIVVDDRRECPQGGVERPHEKPDPKGNAQIKIINLQQNLYHYIFLLN